MDASPSYFSQPLADHLLGGYAAEHGCGIRPASRECTGLRCRGDRKAIQVRLAAVTNDALNHSVIRILVGFVQFAEVGVIREESRPAHVVMAGVRVKLGRTRGDREFVHGPMGL